jgi:hypothetical protein
MHMMFFSFLLLYNSISVINVIRAHLSPLLAQHLRCLFTIASPLRHHCVMLLISTTYDYDDASQAAPGKHQLRFTHVRQQLRWSQLQSITAVWEQSILIYQAYKACLMYWPCQMCIQLCMH